MEKGCIIVLGSLGGFLAVGCLFFLGGGYKRRSSTRSVFLEKIEKERGLIFWY